MGRSQVLIVCVMSLLAMPAHAESSEVVQIQVVVGVVGTVLTFHLQNRLNSVAGNQLDILPAGTVLNVRMLDSIDSTMNRDGAPFRGLVVSSLVSGNRVVIDSEAEVHGLLVLLRSKRHPDGFRYELLVTTLVEHGKSYTLTASASPSFSDPASSATSPPPAMPKQE